MTSNIEQLKKRHAEIYAQFKPTLNSYMEMAREALDIQDKILAATLREAFPDAGHPDYNLVVTLESRHELDKLEEVIAKIKADNSLKITRVIHDTVQSKFHIFAAPEEVKA